MKKLAILAVLGVIAIVRTHAFGQDTHAEQHGDQKTEAPVVAEKPQESEGMGMMMPMQEQMKKMREHIDKICEATNPQERDKLIQEHMKKMHEAMSKMGCMEMMMGMKGERGMSRHGTEDGDTAKRLDMLEKRIDMMQMMGDRMTRHH